MKSIITNSHSLFLLNQYLVEL